MRYRKADMAFLKTALSYFRNRRFCLRYALQRNPYFAVWSNVGLQLQMSLYNQTLYITSSCKFVKCIIWVKLLQLLGLTYRICSVYNRKLMNLKTSVGHKYEIFIRLIQLISEKAFRYLKTLKKAFKKFLIFLTFRMLLILAHFSKNRQDSHRSNTARDSF